MHALLNVPATWAVMLSVLWLTAVLRTPALRRSARRRVSALLFLCLTLAVTLTAPTVRSVLDTATGFADLSILLGHLAMLLAIIFSLRIVTLVSGTRRRSALWGGLPFVAAMAVLVVLFPVIPRRLDQPDFGLWQGGHGAVLAYQLTYQAALGAGLLINAVFLFTYWRRAQRGQVQSSLLLLWLACVLGVGYVIGRTWQILAQGVGLHTLLERFQHAALTLSLFYLSLLCAAASALLRTAHVVWGYLCGWDGYRRLRPLWARLTGAVPDAVLRPPPHPLVDLFSINTLELRLYRRTVEIRDAQLELTGFVPPELRDAAREALRTYDGDIEAALDACTLELALRIKQSGAPRPEHPGAVSWSREASLAGEMNHLLELARLMRHPVVLAAAGTALETRRAIG